MSTPCLNERDLILLHYGEPPETLSATAAAAHLHDCAACRQRHAALAGELARLPAAAPLDPVAALRVTGRVRARLHRSPARRWLPVLGGTVAAAAALVITLVTLPHEDRAPVSDPQLVSSLHGPEEEMDDEMPDLDFLEEYELLEELDFLQQLEGV